MGRHQKDPKNLAVPPRVPCLCGYTPTAKSRVDGVQRVKFKESHPVVGGRGSKWTGKATSAFPSHTPTPVLYE